MARKLGGHVALLDADFDDDSREPPRPAVRWRRGDHWLDLSDGGLPTFESLAEPEPREASA